MTGCQKYALDAAKEITIAKLNSSDMAPTENNGKNVANFFEAVYKKVLELAESDEN